MKFAAIICLGILLSLGQPVVADQAEPHIRPDAVFGDLVWTGVMVPLDGETLLHTDINGSQTRLRLWAVDAPDMDVMPWGPIARAAVDDIVRNQGLEGLTCDQITTNANQWPVVICYWPDRTIKIRSGIEWKSLNAAIIASGWATLDRWAFENTRYLARDAFLNIVPFSADLKLAEGSARNRHVGIWSDYQRIR